MLSCSEPDDALVAACLRRLARLLRNSASRVEISSSFIVCRKRSRAVFETSSRRNSQSSRSRPGVRISSAGAA